MLSGINKSRIFLLPFYELNTEPHTIVNTYLANKEYYGTDEIKDYFYVELHIWNPKIKNEYYINHYHTDSNTVMLILKVPDELIDTRNKLIEGKYSEFSDEYINKYFKEKLSSGNYNTNYRILKKDKLELPKTILPLREYWELVLDIKFSEEQELLSKPNLRSETYDNNRFRYDRSSIPEDIRNYVEYKLETFTDAKLEQLSNAHNSKRSKTDKIEALKDKLEESIILPSSVNSIIEILINNEFRRNERN